MRTMIAFALLLALPAGVASAQPSALWVDRGAGLVMEGRYPDPSSCDTVARMQAAAGARAGCSAIPESVLSEERRQAERAADAAKNLKYYIRATEAVHQLSKWSDGSGRVTDNVIARMEFVRGPYSDQLACESALRGELRLHDLSFAVCKPE